MERTEDYGCCTADRRWGDDLMRASFGQTGRQTGGASHATHDEAGVSWRSRLAAFAALCAQRSAEADASSTIHPDIVAAFRSSQVLAAPLPRRFDGAGLVEASEWMGLLEALRTIGAADLSIGRLFEGHANAVDLVHRLGTKSQITALANAIRAGAMSGVWGADGRDPLRLIKTSKGWLLQGGKILASGTGFVTRPLVTASSEEGQRLVLLELDGEERADLSGWTPLGMRSSATGSVDLSGMIVPDSCLIGKPGDFMRQPHFSGGAWRFCAVHLGGMERLVDLYREQLRSRGRGDDPYQLQRMAACLSAAGSAALWIRAAARQLALRSEESEKSVALSNLARGVTERSALDIMEAVQRGVGLTSFIRPNPIERVARDLTTYLRQPVPDLAMADAARFALASNAPTREIWNFDADQLVP
jgi:alkylation response protein AidB-like acyl-CoA dehydrogenase